MTAAAARIVDTFYGHPVLKKQKVAIVICLCLLTLFSNVFGVRVGVTFKPSEDNADSYLTALRQFRTRSEVAQIRPNHRSMCTNDNCKLWSKVALYVASVQSFLIS